MLVGFLSVAARFNYLVGGLFDQILPDGLKQNVGFGQDASGCRTPFVFNLIKNALVVLFVVVVLSAIVYAAIAGLNYIRSQGEDDKVEEAQKALKSVLVGVGVVFLGIIGVIVITSIFSNTDGNQIAKALATFLDPNNVDACTGAFRAG